MHPCTKYRNVMTKIVLTLAYARAHLKGICWHLNQSLQNVRVFDRASAFFKDVHEWTSIWTPSFLSDICTHIYIIVNIGRAIYSDKQELLEIPIPTTPRKILEAISTVYQRSVTEDYVNTLVEVDGGHCERIQKHYRCWRWRWRQMPSLTRRTTVFRGTQAG
jgi:hypothetical protein